MEGLLAWTEGEARAAASQRLAEALIEFSSLGALVDGEVGYENPVDATLNAMARAEYDMVVISTLPRGLSRWPRLDTVSRLRQAVGNQTPVAHLEAEPEAMAA